MLQFRVLASVCAIAAGGSAAAATVTFEPDRGYHDNVRILDRENSVGTWNEAGFAVDWHWNDDVAEPGEGELYFTNGAYLSDCVSGCFGSGRSLSFSRSDGKAFSLKSLDIWQTKSSAYADVRFTPEPNAERVVAPIYFDDVYLVFDNLVLEATKTDGSTFEVSAPTMLDGEYFAQAGRTVPYMGDGTLELAEFSFELSDLKSLGVSIGWGDRRGFIADSLAFSGADPIFQRMPDDCPLRLPCAVPGLGTFEFSFDFGNYWNWGSQATLDNFAFEVDGPAPTHAPLPAPVMLLAAGLGALGLARSARR